MFSAAILAVLTVLNGSSIRCTQIRLLLAAHLSFFSLRCLFIFLLLFSESFSHSIYLSRCLLISTAGTFTLAYYCFFGDELHVCLLLIRPLFEELEQWQSLYFHVIQKVNVFLIDVSGFALLIPSLLPLSVLLLVTLHFVFEKLVVLCFPLLAFFLFILLGKGSPLVSFLFSLFILLSFCFTHLF